MSVSRPSLTLQKLLILSFIPYVQGYSWVGPLLQTNMFEIQCLLGTLLSSRGRLMRFPYRKKKSTLNLTWKDAWKVTRRKWHFKFPASGPPESRPPATSQILIKSSKPQFLASLSSSSSDSASRCVTSTCLSVSDVWDVRLSSHKLSFSRSLVSLTLEGFCKSNIIPQERTNMWHSLCTRHLYAHFITSPADPKFSSRVTEHNNYCSSVTSFSTFSRYCSVSVRLQKVRLTASFQSD